MAAAFGTEQTTSLKATVVSFGFKYGIPVDADMVADMRFLPNPHWVPELRPLSGRDAEVASYVNRAAGGPGVPRPVRPGARDRQRRLPREGKRFMTVAVGCTGGKHRSVAMTEEIAARLRDRASTPARRTATSGGSDGLATDELPRGRSRTSECVALGGGHGLSASLSALRHVVDDLTAVVTVADNGGSSGRLRREFGVLPPGDLRQALSALCGDDDWGRTWARVLQHRFASDGEMDNHAVGNLLIVTLWELLGDHVGGLDWVARLLGAQGRVLPMAVAPLDITAAVQRARPARPRCASPSSAARSRSPTTAGQVSRRPPGARETAGLPRGGRRSDAVPTGWCSDRAPGSPA